MTAEKRPLGATIATAVMAVVSLWWLGLGVLYFFGSWYWLFYEGIPFVWMLGIVYGFMGLVGLGVAAGLYAGFRQAWTVTLVIVILELVFSIPSLLSGYGIIGAILSASVLVILAIPSTRAYYKHKAPPSGAFDPRRI